MLVHTDPGSVSEPRACAQCGYDLRGLREARCPECGLRFDPTTGPPPEVPWIARREIGRLAGYWRTVWMVVVRPGRLAEQAWRASELHADDAASFRRATAVIAAASVAVIAGVQEALPLANAGDAIHAAVLASAQVILPALAFFWIVTMPTPLDAPTTIAGRVVMQVEPLRAFCCAGLGLSPLVTAAFVAAALFDRVTGRVHTDARTAILAVGGLAVLAAWCRGSMRFLMDTGRIGWNVFMMTAHATVWTAAAVTAAMVVGGMTAPLFEMFRN